ncbi:MAG: NINE protein [Chloroflexi bacterium]|nr:NINE protein [Chloroflexota bacterium]
MSKPVVYPLRWRGRESGPYPLSVIEQKLDAHEIGLWHEIQSDGRWQTLEEFLAALNQQREAQEMHRREEQALAQAADEDRRAREHLSALQELEEQNRWLRQKIEQIERRVPAGPPPRPPPTASAAPAEAASDARRLQAVPTDGGLPGRPVGRSRKRMVFALLGLFLGFLGAHNFYAGYLVKGVTQLALTVCASWLGFGWILTWLWAFCEIILVHTDKKGVLMT